MAIVGVIVVEVVIMKKKISIFFIIAISIITIIYFYTLSNAPLIGIDNYESIYNNNQFGFNLIYAISKGFHRCLSWNARLGEFLFFVIGTLPHSKLILFILSTLFFDLFIILILKYAFDYKDINLKSESIKFFFLIFSIFATILYINPSLWDNFFWMPNICNHLWGLCILLVLFLPFRKFLLDDFDIKGIKLVLYCIACLIAGTISENMVPLFITLCTLIVIFKLIFKKSFRVFTIPAIISLCLGYCYLILSSSTKTRMTFFTTGEWLNAKGDMFSYFFGDFKKYFIIIGVLLIIYFLKQIILKFLLKKNIKIIDTAFIYNFIFYILSFIALLVLILSPYYVSRALLVITFSSLVVIVYLLYKIFSNKIFCIILSLGLLIFIICYSCKINNIFIDYNKFSSLRDNFIYQQVLEKNDKILYPYYDTNVDFRILRLNLEQEICQQNVFNNFYEIDSKNYEFICVYGVYVR